MKKNQFYYEVSTMIRNKKVIKKMIYKLKTCYVNTAYRLYVLIFKNNTRREE